MRLMDPKSILLGVLAAVAVAYFIFWFVTARRQRIARQDHSPIKPTPVQLAIGFVTNFFDALGIGSFATTTAMYRAWKVVRDEQIPGTLNVGHAGPTFVQALIYITIVDVDFTTMIALIAAAVFGAWLGAGIVSGFSRRKVQIGMGYALIGAAGLMLASLTGLGPAPGTALGLSGSLLWTAIGASAVLGALMMLGIGYYAPCLIMISLLGMNPTAAFPIMMGACAFLMPVGSMQFIRKERYDLRAALGLLVAGPFAVLIAAYLVTSLPLNIVRWGVVVIVIYTAISMLRAAAAERKKSMQADPASA